MKRWLILLPLMLLVACGGKPEYKQADGLILCHIPTGRAFSVQYQKGTDSSYVKRTPDADSMCSKKARGYAV